MKDDDAQNLRDEIVGFMDDQYRDLFDLLVTHREVIDPTFVCDALAEKLEDAMEEPEHNGIEVAHVPRLMPLIAEIQGMRDAWWNVDDDED